MIQICSGITCGRVHVLNGELYAQRFTEVDLSGFVHRLVHEDFSLLDGTSMCNRYPKLILLGLSTEPVS